MKPLRNILAVLTALAGVTGCTGDGADPLPRGPDLTATLASLDVTIPPAAGAARLIDIGEPLTIEDIGLLAILNNPDLKSERGSLDVANAAVVQARLMPNPTATVDYGQLVSGPATASSVAASLSQDIAALVTRPARIDAASAHLGAVNADQLWREWQVAQKARQLAVDLYWNGEAIGLVENELRLIDAEVAQVRHAIAAGNLTLTAMAPLLSAQASAEQFLNGLRLAQLKDWQGLDALMGLLPQVRFAIACPRLAPPPANPARLLAELSERRPDLAALRLGYASAEENVRGAILGQFPAFAIGPSYSSDTSNVLTLGPTFTFTLPIFGRNQNKVVAARATRRLLHEQYQARLDAAVANVHALYAQLRRLAADLGPAREAAAAARSLAATARKAYAQGNLDRRSVTDYETTALERAVQVRAIERQIAEDQVMLAVELGLDLPRARIALTGGRS